MSTSGFDGVKTVSVNGAELAYREAGSGAPVVLIHGSASDLRIWTDAWGGNLPDLGSRFRVIGYSRRYARPNADIPPGVDDQMMPHVDDLAALLDALDAAPAHLVGHSWGGFIALLTAIRYPEKVKSLVLMEPPALSLFVSTPPRASEFLKLLLTRPATAIAIARFGSQAAVPAQKAFAAGDVAGGIAAFGRGVLGNRYDQSSEAKRKRVMENAGAVRAQLTGAGFPPLYDDDVRAVRAPALVMTGTDSPAMFPRIADRLVELLPNVEAVTIPAAGHGMQEDNPQAWLSATRAFLDRQA